ncbi:hypothetical protein GCM10009416_40270 [Craurococcus roseus]|uniref:Uncharacterized protein n=1 Tax=Craurococcus roseus TaxID=77585 RepID=A0ABP3QXI2_9PROT
MGDRGGARLPLLNEWGSRGGAGRQRANGKPASVGRVLPGIGEGSQRSDGIWWRGIACLRADKLEYSKNCKLVHWLRGGLAPLRVLL